MLTVPTVPTHFRYLLAPPPAAACAPPSTAPCFTPATPTSAPTRPALAASISRRPRPARRCVSPSSRAPPWPRRTTLPSTSTCSPLPSPIESRPYVPAPHHPANALEKAVRSGKELPNGEKSGSRLLDFAAIVQYSIRRPTGPQRALHAGAPSPYAVATATAGQTLPATRAVVHRKVGRINVRPGTLPAPTLPFLPFVRLPRKTRRARLETCTSPLAPSAARRSSRTWGRLQEGFLRLNCCLRQLWRRSHASMRTQRASLASERAPGRYHAR